MGGLVIKLAAPLQSWGGEPHFAERLTRNAPTKSGIVGLLCAALGRRYEDPIDDLAALPLAVRIDQPGTPVRDFQTAHRSRFDQRRQRYVVSGDRDDAMPLTNRHYLSDAIFVAALGVPDDRLAEFADALDHPAFPLFLGRRSCPPSCRILMGTLMDTDPLAALAAFPWQATSRRLQGLHATEGHVSLDVVRDLMPGDAAGDFTVEVTHDLPLSFVPTNRRYGFRDVVHDKVIVTNPTFRAPRLSDAAHDPLELL